ncbi:MAG: S8 family serine peptidase, partial [Akkermansiaceae bacterium]|nr:S8 family serine peptidase [Armatimonadota bacterium]
MRPFLINPTKRIFSASASVAASVATICSVSLLSGGAVTLTTLLSARAASAAFAKTDAIAVSGEIVLWVPTGINRARVNQIATAASCDVVSNIAAPSQYYLLRLKSVGTTRSVAADGQSVAAIRSRYKIELPSAEVLAAISAIKAAQPDALADPNYIRRPTRQQTPGGQQGVTPNDTFYGEHWDKRMINMPVAWRFQNGGRDVIVSCIDTGFDVGHPDFFRAGVPIYIDPINTGGDFVRDVDGNIVQPPVPILNSLDGHGVHVAGTIAAVTNNGEGVSGVAGLNDFGVNIRLLPIKASTRITIEGEGDAPDVVVDAFLESSLIDGILQSVSRGAVAINMSLGGFGSSAVESQAVTEAIRGGTLIVAATGNDAISADTLPAFPANYPGVIAVSAVDSQRRLASYSNYGGNTTITAPGGDISSGGLLSLEIASSTLVLSTFQRGLTGLIDTVSGVS